MTRILVISDIHSNYTALKAVFSEARPYDLVLFAGDIVGFGPHPNECVHAIRRQKTRCVKGNHDQGIILDDYSSFPDLVGEADSLNRRLLSIDNFEWLQSLPETYDTKIEGLKISVMHANPVTPLKGYVQEDEAKNRLDEFQELTDADVLILGHTHRPYIHQKDGFTLLNPGSVGLPRDEARSSFMVLSINDGELTVSHRRLKYDYDSNSDAMSQLGLPEKYVERMRTGPKPP